MDVVVTDVAVTADVLVTGVVATKPGGINFLLAADENTLDAANDQPFQTPDSEAGIVTDVTVT